jgi:Domain of unknown function (DUF4920)
MKKLFTFISLAFLSVSALAQTQTFGASIKADKPVQATETIGLLKDKKEVTDVTLTATVLEVCQAKGCWMTVDAGNGEKMTVKFKDYAFFMPKDCAGKNVTFQGKMSKQVISVAELKHYAEDAGKSKKEIKKIKKPKEEYRFEAIGVVLAG